MILQRLYELAQRENLLADPAFDTGPVACGMNFNADGKYLGLRDLRGQQTIPASKKDTPPKTVFDKGRPLTLPVRPVVFDGKINAWKTTDPASSGKEKPAIFLVDILPLLDPQQGRAGRPASAGYCGARTGRTPVEVCRARSNQHSRRSA